MLRRVLAKLRGFSNDDCIATLEFALVAAPFIGFIVAIFQSFVAQIYITYLDRAVQSFAAELRSGSIITYDTKTQELMQQLINTRLCPRVIRPDGSSAAFRSRSQMQVISG